MTCQLSEEDLWSGLDRNAPEVAEHVSQCDRCRARAAEFRAGVTAVEKASRPPEPPLPEQIGSYVVRRRLGQGGMGIVYEAEQQTPRRSVAIKVVRGGEFEDEYRVRLFQREAQTLGRLRHPAIASIYEAGRTEEGQHFFAMELVVGTPLTEFAREQGLTIRDRLELFRKVCAAINYAHQRGVIHRDLKPTNILVTAEGDPKILDFGLARITDPDVSMMSTLHDVGRLMGTLPYMSPEEARGDTDSVDVRSDVYALGVILYELLTGELPFVVRRDAIPDAIRTISEDQPKRPRAIDRSLRGELETIVLKALEKDPDRRYQTAAMLAEDIERYLTSQPILARRASAVYQIRKFVVRHRLFVGLAAASVVVVAAGKVWVDRTMTRGEEEAKGALLDKYELADAITQAQFAELLRESHRLDEAEPKYRNALATFLRQSEDDRAAPVMVSLGLLLIDREQPSEKDYLDAEGFFLDALDIFRGAPLKWREELLQALAGLRVLYGPEVFDVPADEIPTEVTQIEAQLSRLEAEAEARKNRTGPLKPQ